MIGGFSKGSTIKSWFFTFSFGNGRIGLDTSIFSGFLGEVFCVEFNDGDFWGTLYLWASAVILFFSKWLTTDYYSVLYFTLFILLEKDVFVWFVFATPGKLSSSFVFMAFDGNVFLMLGLWSTLPVGSSMRISLKELLSGTLPFF